MASILTAERVSAVLGDRLRVIDALAEVENSARGVVDPFILGVAEQRVAQLLGVAPDLLAELDDGAGAPIDADGQAAIVAFVEQWVIDVASMPHDLVEPVRAHLGDDGLIDFLHGLLMVEQRVRLALAWRQLGLVPA